VVFALITLKEQLFYVYVMYMFYLMCVMCVMCVKASLCCLCVCVCVCVCVDERRWFSVRWFDCDAISFHFIRMMFNSDIYVCMCMYYVCMYYY